MTPPVPTPTLSHNPFAVTAPPDSSAALAGLAQDTIATLDWWHDFAVRLVVITASAWLFIAAWFAFWGTTFLVVEWCKQGGDWRAVGPWSHWTQAGKDRIAAQLRGDTLRATTQRRDPTPSSQGVAVEPGSTGSAQPASQVAMVEAQVRLTADLMRMAEQQGRTVTPDEAARMAREMLLESGL